MRLFRYTVIPLALVASLAALLTPPDAIATCAVAVAPNRSFTVVNYTATLTAQGASAPASAAEAGWRMGFTQPYAEVFEPPATFKGHTDGDLTLTYGPVTYR